MSAEADTVLPETARRMARVRHRDTAAELALRRSLFAAGLRYRVQYPVEGKPRRTIDIAFTRAKVAVFVDGCYWHGCPVHGTQARNNAAWWRSKIATNQQRDVDTSTHLERLGWVVIRVWEHEGTGEGLARVVAALAAQRHDDQQPAGDR